MNTSNPGNPDGSKITLTRKGFLEHLCHFYKTRLYPLLMPATIIVRRVFRVSYAVGYANEQHNLLVFVVSMRRLII